MRTIKLVTKDGKTLYEGQHRNISEAIEFAVTRGTKLDYIDLSGQLLPHINLDGIVLYHADFSGADLTGANMSEADFIDCDFSSADLTQACCCYSNFFGCNFRGAQFSGTDIAMACLTSCQFEGVSAFNLCFESAFKLARLTYYQEQDSYAFDEAPIIVRSPRQPMMIIGKDIVTNRTYRFLASVNETGCGEKSAV